ncbi:MAG: hypothetical protein AAGC56_07520 [Pseudomonadota bacterium]
MPYGTKRGIRTPGQFGVGDYLGLALAGATGIVAALITDYNSKGEASAIYTINQWAVAGGRLLGIEAIPLYAVVLGMIAIGAGSIFYFQPITRQGAFAQGFGLLAVMMTAVPSDLAGGLEAISADLVQREFSSAEPRENKLRRDVAFDDSSFATREARVAASVQHASFTPDPAAAEEPRLVLAQASSTYNVSIRITFEGGLPPNVRSMTGSGALRGRLHNPDTQKTYNLFKSAGGRITVRGDAILIRAGISATQPSTTLWARVEAEGYAIEQVSKAARVGTTTNWTIAMKKSTTPLFVQRLGKSYWF